MVVAILVATAGVVVMSLKGKGAMEGGSGRSLLGLFSGAMFALSAVGYRGAILSLGLPSFVLAATFTLTVGLVMQAGAADALSRAPRPRRAARHHAGLAAVAVRGLHGRDRVGVLVPGVRARPASPMCARSALVEVLFAQAISFFIFKQATTKREALGMALIVLGVALLIWVQ